MADFLAEQQENIKWIQDENAAFEQRTGRIPLSMVHTFGCQQNVSDGERIQGILALMGYGFTEDPASAELIVLNTCAVRENAEDRVFGTLGAYKALKRKNPGLRICLCGCMTQQPHIAEKIRQSYPQADLVFGTHALSRFPELLRSVMEDSKRQFALSGEDGMAEDIPVRRSGKIQAWLPVMHGCNNYCTYCIVPYVRGREVSRESEKIEREFGELIASGVKEVTLLGQNVNSYGCGLEEKMNFAGLLRRLNETEGDFRIRFMSSHPKDATFELIDTIAEGKKISPHFHLPVQSGSDRILALMNRHYTVEQYLKLVEYAKKRLPDISFTTDILVGFPGETEEDFLQTLALMKKVRFDSIFSFIYSKRVGTKAAEMEDPVSPQEKSERFQRLLALQREISAERCAEWVGKTCRVLVEGEGREKGTLSGRNGGYMIVDFPGNKDLIGQFVDVRITKALGWALIGELL